MQKFKRRILCYISLMENILCDVVIFVAIFSTSPTILDFFRIKK